MDFKIDKVERHDDNRGKLIILLKKNDLQEKDQVFGEVFYITFSKKGITRANHYHRKWREWFIVVSGKIQVKLEDVKTKKQFSIILDAKSNIKRLEIGPYIAHSFTSLSKGAVLLNYANQTWKARDVIPYIVAQLTRTRSGKKR